MVAERRPAVNGTRQRLIEAATNLFAERGYQQATLAAIGAAAGVTAPALYRHFGSKDDLLQAVLVTSLEEAQAQIEIALREPDLATRLEKVISAHLELRLRLRAGEGPAAFSIGHLAPLLPADTRAPVTALVKHHIATLSRLLHEGAEAGVFKEFEPTPTAMAILGLCDAVMALRPGGRLSSLELKRLFQRLVLEMVVRA